MKHKNRKTIKQKNNKTIISILFLVIALAVSGCGKKEISKPVASNNNAVQQENQDTSANANLNQSISSDVSDVDENQGAGAGEDEDGEEIDMSDWKTYRNEELSIYFNYPKEFGEITAMREGNDHIIFKVFENDILLAMDNGTQSVSRGAYWGDQAEFITSQEYINNKCNNKQNCHIITNQYNISFAKEKADLVDYDGSSRDVLFYYFYNLNSKFKGLIISDERLKDNNIKNLEEKIDLIADSLHYGN